MEDPTVANHILSNGDAYLYITSMREGYENLEESLDHGGMRVERFGMETIVVKRMLQTNNIHSLALFLGKNNTHKMTTVFVGKDSYGNLLIDANSPSSTAGRVYDLTTPCPPFNWSDIADE